MKLLKRIKDYFKRLKEKREFKRKIEEIKRRDPFTYNH